MSHFTVLVIGEDVEGQLAPYDENIEVAPYKSYWDTDEIVRWESILEEEGRDGSEPGLDAGKDHTMEEIAAAYNSRYHSEGDEDHLQVDEGGIYYMTTYNPKSRWDWYEVGGRWRGYFKAREGVNGNAHLGRPGVFDNEARYDCDQLRKGEIDVEFMRNDAGLKAGANWDKAVALFGDTEPAKSWQEVLADQTDDDGVTDYAAAREAYGQQERVKHVREQEEGTPYEDQLFGPFGYSIEDFQMSRELFVQDARDGALATFAFVRDGEWSEAGKMGWWGMSSATTLSRREHRRAFNEMFDALPDDTLVTLLDCHI